MKKKLVISATIIIMLFLISSTALADPPIQDYNGNAYNYFTSRTTSQDLDEYIGYTVYDWCDVCYVTKPSGRVPCAHQSYVIRTDTGEKLGFDMYVTAGTQGQTSLCANGEEFDIYHVKLRIRNYQFNGEYQMHTEGQWQVY